MCSNSLNTEEQVQHAYFVNLDLNKFMLVSIIRNFSTLNVSCPDSLTVDVTATQDYNHKLRVSQCHHIGELCAVVYNTFVIRQFMQLLSLKDLVHSRPAIYYGALSAWTPQWIVLCNLYPSGGI